MCVCAHFECSTSQNSNDRHRNPVTAHSHRPSGHLLIKSSRCQNIYVFVIRIYGRLQTVCQPGWPYFYIYLNGTLSSMQKSWKRNCRKRVKRGACAPNRSLYAYDSISLRRLYIFLVLSELCSARYQNHSNVFYWRPMRFSLVSIADCVCFVMFLFFFFLLAPTTNVLVIDWPPFAIIIIVFNFESALQEFWGIASDHSLFKHRNAVYLLVSLTYRVRVRVWFSVNVAAAALIQLIN